MDPSIPKTPAREGGGVLGNIGACESLENSEGNGRMGVPQYSSYDITLKFSEI